MLIVLIGFVVSSAQALETDQFTLPPAPLEEIGSHLDAIYAQAVVRAIEKANVEIESAFRSGKADKIAEVRAKQLMPEYLASLVYQQIGRGLPKSTVEKKLEKIDVPKERAFFKPKAEDSIFRGVFSPVLLTFKRIQSTALIHGHYVGLDKVGHAFQQGYSYYKNTHENYRKGMPLPQALAKEVRAGHATEKGFFGTLVSGIFSNGDLASNYAGYKIYENLTAEVTINNVTYPALAVLDGQTWKLQIAPEQITLRSFVSEHWSEARNPSIYTFHRGKIRKALQVRCAGWFEQMPGMTLESERANRVRMTTWFGEDYGWKDPEDQEVSLATECFQRD